VGAAKYEISIRPPDDSWQVLRFTAVLFNH